MMFMAPVDQEVVNEVDRQLVRMLAKLDVTPGPNIDLSELRLLLEQARLRVCRISAANMEWDQKGAK